MIPGPSKRDLPHPKCKKAHQTSMVPLHSNSTTEVAKAAKTTTLRFSNPDISWEATARRTSSAAFPTSKKSKQTKATLSLIFGRSSPAIFRLSIWYNGPKISAVPMKIHSGWAWPSTTLACSHVEPPAGSRSATPTGCDYLIWKNSY